MTADGDANPSRIHVHEFNAVSYADEKKGRSETKDEMKKGKKEETTKK